MDAPNNPPLPTFFFSFDHALSEEMANKFSYSCMAVLFRLKDFSKCFGWIFFLRRCNHGVEEKIHVKQFCLAFDEQKGSSYFSNIVVYCRKQLPNKFSFSNHCLSM